MIENIYTYIDEFAELLRSIYSTRNARDDFDILLKKHYQEGIDDLSEGGSPKRRYREICEALIGARGNVELDILASYVEDDRPERIEIKDFRIKLRKFLQLPAEAVDPVTNDDSPSNSDDGLHESTNVIDSYIGETPHSQDKLSSEKVQDPNKDDFDPNLLGEWLLSDSRKVCRIEINGDAQGTGFLVSNDLILTAYHTLEKVWSGKNAFSDVTVTFDFAKKSSQSSKELWSNTVESNLQSLNWLVAYSLPNAQEVKNRLIDDNPLADNLDYALLWITKSPGNDVFGDQTRGWFSIKKSTELPTLGSNLYLLHHPKGQPLKYSQGDRIVKVSDSGSRVDYKTNTDQGSSGSPCFNADHDLIAMHCYGVSNKFNRGIPIVTVVSDLREKGCLKFLERPSQFSPLSWVLEQIHIALPRASPFFDKLVAQARAIKLSEEGKSKLAHMLNVILQHSTSKHHQQSHWLFTAIGLHLFMGDIKMKESETDQFSEHYLHFGFDQPQLRDELLGDNVDISKFHHPYNSIFKFHPDDFNGTVYLDDYYGTERASFFLRQLIQALDGQIPRLKQLHTKWPDIWIGSQIIEDTKQCLLLIKSHVERSLGLFQMYRQSQREKWQSEETFKYDEFEELSERISSLVVELANEFQSLNPTLIDSGIDKTFTTRLNPKFRKLEFYLDEYGKVIDSLVAIIQQS